MLTQFAVAFSLAVPVVALLFFGHVWYHDPSKAHKPACCPRCGTTEAGYFSYGYGCWHCRLCGIAVDAR